MDRNVERYQKNLVSLKAADWQLLVIWECELRDIGVVSARTTDFLGEK